MYFDVHKKIIVLDPDPIKNVIQIDSADWQLLSLDIPTPPNSFIFQAYPLEDEAQRAVVKICRYHSGETSKKSKRRAARFEREIEALKKIKASGILNIAVDLFADDKYEIHTTAPTHPKTSFRFYVMEKADRDLASYLAGSSIGEQQRLLICASLLQSLKQLHTLDIYHRDIKPANILLFGDQWKLADLGLAAFRNEDVELDLPNERIGPIGWLSPEAVNKACSNRSHPKFDADIDISDASDIFQLGKLFWYIIQGSVPTGQMDITDCKLPALFTEIISPMLQYSKERRAPINRLEVALHPILKRYGI